MYRVVSGSRNQVLTISRGNGNIGIGISNPLDKLHVDGSISIKPDDTNSPSYINFKRSSDGWTAVRIGQAYNQLNYGGHIIFETNTGPTTTTLAERMRITYDGKVGIGTTSPLDKLHVDGNISIKPDDSNSPSYINFKRTSDGWTPVRIGQAYNQLNYGGHIIFETNAGSSPTSLVERMRITYSGNVLVGKISQVNSAYKLDVDGSIRSNEIVVNADGADFVFEDNYKLRDLQEVENFIEKNKHLPDIESAKEIQINGLELGKMDMKLLQKIEEMTLYMIEFKKEVNKMKEENQKLI